MFLKVHTPYWHGVQSSGISLNVRFMLEKFAVFVHSISALEQFSMLLHNIRIFHTEQFSMFLYSIKVSCTGTVFNVLAQYESCSHWNSY